MVRTAAEDIQGNRNCFGQPYIQGGIVAVSFLNDDRTVTITGNNVPADETQILYKVSDLITECCKEEIL